MRTGESEYNRLCGKHLPEAELEIMQVVWKCEEPVSASYILSEQTGRDWALPTLMTVLSRLTQKGFLICEKHGRNNYYRPAVSEESYKAAEGKTMLKKLYRNSFPDMVASLYNGKAIQKEDLLELKKMIDELAGEGDIHD
ncbi:BlaI/MecI/CopY family transcriptional regulator [Diplocloster modestus]|uniref:BlaI/MecI/CopY family transcriptional regulator n=1 Tax=Diplocloster modestus TaxID=2850322 RepID=A0ABS6KCG3_9FIRM|nr:BlaI/MecI/CopY family transcriptional regulator [Diplocloster modestus]MBU9728206.1 BlaI/MecI/CopY family transcriptional regulator [Diplocloster modestus]